MPKFSLCIETVLPEVDFYDRILAAADLGFDAVEFWDPNGRDLERIAQLASQRGLAVSVCCLWAAWQNPMSAPWEMVERNLRTSASAAQTLGCSAMIALSGMAEGDPAAQAQRLSDNLQRAAQLCETLGLTLVLEALNTQVDHAGYFLNSSRLGFDMLRKINSPRMRLLYDVYHMQIMEGNLIDTIRTNAQWIGHFHSAGVPGRHELSQSEINYPAVVQAVDQSGYTGYFGLEYYPSYDHRASLRSELAALKA